MKMIRLDSDALVVANDDHDDAEQRVSSSLPHRLSRCIRPLPASIHFVCVQNRLILAGQAMQEAIPIRTGPLLTTASPVQVTGPWWQ